MDTKLGTEGRKDLFDWLSRQLSGLSNFPDAVETLSKDDLASRLTLTTDDASVGPFLLSDALITIIDIRKCSSFKCVCQCTNSAMMLIVELFGALRGRLYDSNKNLIMATLSTIGAVASAMGLAVEKSSFNGILSDVLKCLGDNNKQMRESTLTTLDAWLAAVHLDK
ncbi:hypothetical protein ACSBR2_009419 [Camellia fascicularis]